MFSRACSHSLLFQNVLFAICLNVNAKWKEDQRPDITTGLYDWKDVTEESAVPSRWIWYFPYRIYQKPLLMATKHFLNEKKIEKEPGQFGKGIHACWIGWNITQNVWYFFRKISIEKNNLPDSAVALPACAQKIKQMLMIRTETSRNSRPSLFLDRAHNTAHNNNLQPQLHNNF